MGYLPTNNGWKLAPLLDDSAKKTLATAKHAPTFANEDQAPVLAFLPLFLITIREIVHAFVQCSHLFGGWVFWLLTPVLSLRILCEFFNQHFCVPGLRDPQPE